MKLLLFFALFICLQGFTLAKVFPYKEAEKRCIRQEYYPHLYPKELQEWRHNLTAQLEHSSGSPSSTTSGDNARLRINKCMATLVCGVGGKTLKSYPRHKPAGSCRWPMMASVQVAAISRWLPDCPHYRGYYMKHPFDATCRQYLGCVTSTPFGIYTVTQFACNSEMMFDDRYAGNCIPAVEYYRRYGGGCKAAPWPEKAISQLGWTGPHRSGSKVGDNEI